MMMVSDSNNNNATTAAKKAMSSTLSFLLRRNSFNSSKCKTEAKMATARIKLLRNKREVLVRQMRRDLALLLQSGQEETARIRVEHAIREQKVLAANEIIETFCELIVTRLPILAKQRDCPEDMKECISSLIYASPRCSEIPELSRLKNIFEKKYGKEFVAAAADLRHDSGVNRMLIEKLSVRKPSGEVKLKVLKEIAKEYQVKWDPSDSEKELLKPPEEVLEGPRTFASATSFPVNQSISQNTQPKEHETSSGDKTEDDNTMPFTDTFSAAKAAAESAQKAISAAQAAAFLANATSHHPFDQVESVKQFNHNKANLAERQMPSSMQPSESAIPPNTERKGVGKVFVSQSFNKSSSNYDEYGDDNPNFDTKIVRGNSCTGRVRQSEIKFDDSDGFETDNEDFETESSQLDSPPPPNRLPPALPPRRKPEEKAFDDYSETQNGNVGGGSHVHPKLPDYEAFTARFEALKLRRT